MRCSKTFLIGSIRDGESIKITETSTVLGIIWRAEAFSLSQRKMVEVCHKGRPSCTDPGDKLCKMEDYAEEVATMMKELRNEFPYIY